MSTTMNTNAPAITHTPGRASNVGLWVLQAVLAFQFAGGGIMKAALRGRRAGGGRRGRAADPAALEPRSS